MKIYDISQEVFGCEVYPGDEGPIMRDVKRTKRGDAINLTCFSMCAHNGTHIDAPFHFLGDRSTIEKIPLEKTIGPCFVAEFNGKMSFTDAEMLLHKANTEKADSSKRILIKGNAVITSDAARAFVKSGTYLLGVEPQSVSEVKATMEVHKLLLDADVVLLEGIRLSEVTEGSYFLSSAPISLGGSDGAPCRAVLIEF